MAIRHLVAISVLVGFGLPNYLVEPAVAQQSEDSYLLLSPPTLDSNQPLQNVTPVEVPASQASSFTSAAAVEMRLAELEQLVQEMRKEKPKPASTKRPRSNAYCACQPGRIIKLKIMHEPITTRTRRHSSIRARPRGTGEEAEFGMTAR